jgi:hypothetical protein
VDEGDAVKAIRSATIALVTAGMVWLLSVESLAAKLERRDAVRHLVAWLSLREKFSSFNWDFAESHGFESITTEARPDQAWFDRSERIAGPLTIRIHWPTDITYTLA